jgi:hypothetical protein
MLLGRTWRDSRVSCFTQKGTGTSLSPERSNQVRASKLLLPIGVGREGALIIINLQWDYEQYWAVPPPSAKRPNTVPGSQPTSCNTNVTESTCLSSMDLSHPVSRSVGVLFQGECLVPSMNAAALQTNQSRISSHPTGILVAPQSNTM